MKASLSQISVAVIASSLTTLMVSTPQVAQAGSIRLDGRVIDILGNPVPEASTVTRLFIGDTQYPPIDDFTFDATSDANGIFSAYTSVGPNLIFAVGGSRVTANVVVSPTESSQDFVSQAFNITNFRSDENLNFVADATFKVTPVPETSNALAILALGVLGALSVWQRKQAFSQQNIDNSPKL